MKPFKDQGWVYYDRCKTIMYASKARGGRAFFAGVGSAVTPVSSSSSNIVMGLMATAESTPATDPFINSFGEIDNMSNTIASLYAAQSQVKPTFPPIGHAGVTGDDGEIVPVSSSSYGIKHSHDSTTTTTSIPPSCSSQSPSYQPPPSMQSTGPSSDPSIPSNPDPLPSTSPPKKRSKGSKMNNVIAPPSHAQKQAYNSCSC